MKSLFVFVSLLAVSVVVNGNYFSSKQATLEGYQTQQQGEETKHDLEEAQAQATYTTNEILAQAMCQASAPYGARVYAVGRKCLATSTTTCHDICYNRQLRNQDGQIRNVIVDCIAAYHVYLSRPSTNKNGDEYSATLGLKSIEVACNHAGCGPNYCCCMGRP